MVWTACSEGRPSLQQLAPLVLLDVLAIVYMITKHRLVCVDANRVTTQANLKIV